MKDMSVNKGTLVTVAVGSRKVTARVNRVNDRPEQGQPIDRMNYWDLEYTIIPPGSPGRWKQNVDGGEVTVLQDDPVIVKLWVEDPRMSAFEEKLWHILDTQQVGRLTDQERRALSESLDFYRDYRKVNQYTDDRVGEEK